MNEFKDKIKVTVKPLTVPNTDFVELAANAKNRRIYDSLDNVRRDLQEYSREDYKREIQQLSNNGSNKLQEFISYVLSLKAIARKRIESSFYGSREDAIELVESDKSLIEDCDFLSTLFNEMNLGNVLPKKEISNEISNEEYDAVKVISQLYCSYSRSWEYGGCEQEEPLIKYTKDNPVIMPCINAIKNDYYRKMLLDNYNMAKIRIRLREEDEQKRISE